MICKKCKRNTGIRIDRLCPDCFHERKARLKKPACERLPHVCRRKAKPAANCGLPARNLPHAHAVRRDQFQTKMSVGFRKTLKGYQAWFKIDHQQFYLQEVDTKKEVEFYKKMVKIALKRLKTNKSDG